MGFHYTDEHSADEMLRVLNIELGDNVAIVPQRNDQYSLTDASYQDNADAP